MTGLSQSRHQPRAWYLRARRVSLSHFPQMPASRGILLPGGAWKPGCCVPAQVPVRTELSGWPPLGSGPLSWTDTSTGAGSRLSGPSAFWNYHTAPPECHTSLRVLSSNTPCQGCVQHPLKVSAEHLQEWKGLPLPRLAARLQILGPSPGAQRDPKAVHPDQAVQAFGGQEMVNNNCI